MANCKHFVVRWVGPGNDNITPREKIKTWGGGSHGFFKKKNKNTKTQNKLIF